MSPMTGTPTRDELIALMDRVPDSGPEPGLDIDRLASALAAALPAIDGTGWPRDDAIRIAAEYEANHAD